MRAQRRQLNLGGEADVVVIELHAQLLDNRLPPFNVVVVCLPNAALHVLDPLAHRIELLGQLCLRIAALLGELLLQLCLDAVSLLSTVLAVRALGHRTPSAATTAHTAVATAGENRPAAGGCRDGDFLAAATTTMVMVMSVTIARDGILKIVLVVDPLQERVCRAGSGPLCQHLRRLLYRRRALASASTGALTRNNGR
jgi:hypothetical protein